MGSWRVRARSSNGSSASVRMSSACRRSRLSPTTRGPYRRPILEMLMASIDISEIRFEWRMTNSIACRTFGSGPAVFAAGQSGMPRMEIQLLRGDDGSFFEERENGITLTAVAIMHPVEDGLCGTHLQMDRGYTLPPSVPPHGWDPTVHPLVRAMTGDWTITIYLPP